MGAALQPPPVPCPVEVLIDVVDVDDVDDVDDTDDVVDDVAVAVDEEAPPAPAVGAAGLPPHAADVSAKESKKENRRMKVSWLEVESRRE